MLEFVEMPPFQRRVSQFLHDEELRKLQLAPLEAAKAEVKTWLQRRSK